MQQIVTPHG